MGTNNPTSQALILNSTFSECQKLYDFIEGFTLSQGISSETTHDLKLIAEEIFANIVNHSYNHVLDQKIEILISIDNGNIKMIFTDDAPAYDPTESSKNNDNNHNIEEGGMGIRIIKSLSSNQEYNRINEQNVLTITKHYNG
jgi:anti-sigma regulatory factor (Ser/Thr protein kinase)